jgi:predicted GTPase
METQQVVIMGAAGRDFHNFNTYFRDNEAFRVVAFTATQIPDIEGRTYPAALAGALYPEGIPIYPEAELTDLIEKHGVDQVIFAYSDVPHEYVMHKASQVLAAGADFRLMGVRNTRLKSKKPVVAVCAVRTGSGKSQTTRRVSLILRDMGYKVVIVRHPMPYGDLVSQSVQRFADYADLDEQNCTIEEREEYEPHLNNGMIVYAGVDYERILRQAEAEADVVLWDGGNNDVAFFQPDLTVVVADPHRPGHESTYHPGETNVHLADVFVINKVDTADAENVIAVRESLRAINPEAIVIEAASPLIVDDPAAIRGKRVLVDPRPFAVGSILETYAHYPNTGDVLPAMGYGQKQIKELEQTIDNADCDLVLIGTPIGLDRLIEIDKPSQRVLYELQEIGRPNLEDVLTQKFPKDS